MSVSITGIKPVAHYNKEVRAVVKIINEELAHLESQLVSKTPTGISSQLKGAWVLNPASYRYPGASLSNNSQYFLPVELGRKPGKGISAKGQRSLSRWAQLKLGMEAKESRNFAYLVSEKYKREGRSAAGFAGLAKPGQDAENVNLSNIEPVDNGLIAKTFRVLDRRLTTV